MLRTKLPSDLGVCDSVVGQSDHGEVSFADDFVQLVESYLGARGLTAAKKKKKKKKKKKRKSKAR